MEEMKIKRNDVLQSPQKVPAAKLEEEPVQLEGKTTSIAMIVGPKEAKKSKKEMEQYMKKMTHLHLENKKLELISNLGWCESLTHIYLHDNLIYTLVNDPFPNLKNLVQMSLYQNRIDKMEGFLELVSLKKLYIEKNCLTKLDGLDNCRQLETEV